MNVTIERRVAKLERAAYPPRPPEQIVVGPFVRDEDELTRLDDGSPTTDSAIEAEVAATYASGRARPCDTVRPVLLVIIAPPEHDRVAPMPSADSVEVQPRADMLAVIDEIARDREEAARPAPQPKRVAPLITRLTGMDLAPRLGHGGSRIKL